MNKEHFTNILKASNDCVKAIDAIIPEIEKHRAGDGLWADFEKEKREASRAAFATDTINSAADTAQRKAQTELDTMRAAFKRYMTSTSDPGALQALQALISAGVELTPAEVEAYAATADYAVLRLLEPHSKGRVKAPDPVQFEKDMRDIAAYFDILRCYSGPNTELSAYITGRVLGLPPKTSGTIVRDKSAHLQKTLDEIADRWEIVRE